jgi:hypothetical protein
MPSLYAYELLIFLCLPPAEIMSADCPSWGAVVKRYDTRIECERAKPRPQGMRVDFSCQTVFRGPPPPTKE